MASCGNLPKLLLFLEDAMYTEELGEDSFQSPSISHIHLQDHGDARVSLVPTVKVETPTPPCFLWREENSLVLMGYFPENSRLYFSHLKY
jgi:hypothetical protein